MTNPDEGPKAVPDEQGWTMGPTARREEPPPATLKVEPARKPPGERPPAAAEVESEYPPTTWREAKAEQKRLREENRWHREEERGDQMPGFLSWPLDLILMVLVAWAAFLGITSSYTGYGHSWDEALYLQPGQKAMEWVSRAIGGDNSVLSREEIRAHWGERMEDPLHPEIAPVPKLLIGLGDSRVLESWGFVDVPDPLAATRLPHAILFGLTVALVYLIAARDGGRIAGLMAAVALGMAPRVFGHGHIAASETALLFMTVLMVAVWQAGMRAWLLGLLFAGPVMGLLLATKVTAAVVPIPLMVWALIYRRENFGPAAFSLMFLAPATLFAVSPWFWHDTVLRLAEYAQFYAGHQSTALWYQGRPWGYTYGPSAPWHYPLAMLGAGVPEWILVFALGGLVRAIWGWRRRPMPVLWLLVGASWLLIASLPAAPKYDGDRLFLPVMVFLALLCGHGLAGLLTLAFERRLYRTRTLSVMRVVTGLFIVAVCAGWGWWDLRTWQGAHLNYFNKVVGGAPGAQRLGFETTYWGEALDERALAWLRNNTRETSGARIQVLALNPLALENLQGWGMLPRDLVINDDGPPPVDWYIIQNREGFHGRLERSVWATSAALALESGGLIRLKIVDGQKYFNEREETPAVGPDHPPLTAAVPPPPPPVEVPVEPPVTTGTVEIIPVAPPQP